ncbi:hypothetical protein BJV82DRAFT_576270 [Fennellomyces sp. T-0311]|nr:hypothetical protein BJV82DRAFT_576270 [Fennellomyces sp. T-0311]
MGEIFDCDVSLMISPRNPEDRQAVPSLLISQFQYWNGTMSASIEEDARRRLALWLENEARIGNEVLEKIRRAEESLRENDACRDTVSGSVSIASKVVGYEMISNHQAHWLSCDIFLPTPLAAPNEHTMSRRRSERGSVHHVFDDTDNCMGMQ